MRARLDLGDGPSFDNGLLVEAYRRAGVPPLGSMGRSDVSGPANAIPKWCAIGCAKEFFRTALDGARIRRNKLWRYCDCTKREGA